jgi:hypothetical protein
MRRSEVEKVGDREAGKVKRKAVENVVDLRIKAKGQRIKVLILKNISLISAVFFCFNLLPFSFNLLPD